MTPAKFEDGPFLIMELVEGESLRALLRRGPVPVSKVLDIGIQAATALSRAHECGITHRDLKPENDHQAVLAEYLKRCFSRVGQQPGSSVP